MHERASGRKAQGERTSEQDRSSKRERETERESSRRCDALPHVEVIDRGCNENGGVTRRVRGCGGKRREVVEGTAEERGRNARRARKRRRGSECKRRLLEGFACSCIDRRRLSCASAPPCIPPPSLPPPPVPWPPPANSCSSGSPSLSLLHPSPPFPSPPLTHPPPFVISPGAHPFLSQAESRAPRGPDLAQPPNQRRRRHGGCCARRACERDPQN